MANQAGGNDNATVVVLDVMVGEPPRAEADAAHAAGAAAGATPTISGRTRRRCGAAAAAGSTMVESRPESPAPASTEPAPAGTVNANGAGAAVVSRSAPEVDRPRPPSRRYDPAPERRIPRRITFRVVLFLVVLGGLAYAGYAADPLVRERLLLRRHSATTRS